MASLNHRPSSAVCDATAISGRTFIAWTLRDATEDEGGVVSRIDAQPYAAPCDQAALAGNEVLDLTHRFFRWAAHEVVAEMQPEFLWSRGQRDGTRDRIGAVAGLLQEPNDIIVVDRQKLQIGRLMQRAVVAPDPVEPAKIILDVARLIPVARGDFVFFRVEVFLAAGNRLVLEQLEAVVDAIIR